MSVTGIIALKANCRLGVITDNSRERFDVLKKTMDLPTIFDCFVVSGEIGSRKDSALNFRAALNLTGAKPEECVFIDNNPSNLIVPEELGFKVIFHDHEQNDISGLRKHLRECGLTL